MYYSSKFVKDRSVLLFSLTGGAGCDGVIIQYFLLNVLKYLSSVVRPKKKSFRFQTSASMGFFLFKKNRKKYITIKKKFPKIPFFQFHKSM